MNILTLIIIILFVLVVAYIVNKEIKEKSKKLKDMEAEAKAKANKKINIITIIISAITIILIIASVISMNSNKTIVKGETQEPPTIEQQLKTKTKYYLQTRLMLEYSCKNADADVTTIKINGNTATVYGTTMVRDNYNDTYKGKFSGTIYFSVENGEIKTFNTSDIEVDKLYKSK